VGGINIDECRIDYNGEIPNIGGRAKHTRGDGYGFKALEENCVANTSGRFPANVIHDGSDEVESLFPYTKSGKMTSEHQRHTDGSPNGIYGKFDKEYPLSETYGDSGSASRFFYCAKASKKDRDEGLGIAASTINETPRKNTHPTVKPCELMQYLVRLVSPKGATILDPFMGSGSTGKACMFENRERQADYKFIGIDLEEEYCNIASARIDYALNKYEYDFQKEMQEAKERGQMSLF
jgi:site-specific DNA-methyltransferase (adenine-specific)